MCRENIRQNPILSDYLWRYYRMTIVRHENESYICWIYVCWINDQGEKWQKTKDYVHVFTNVHVHTFLTHSKLEVFNNLMNKLSSSLQTWQNIEKQRQLRCLRQYQALVIKPVTLSSGLSVKADSLPLSSHSTPCYRETQACVFNSKIWTYHVRLVQK